jgi:hypothetical protein
MMRGIAGFIPAVPGPIGGTTPAAGSFTTVTASAQINEAQGADVASVNGVTDIGAATGNFVRVTGTNAITGFGTVQAGTRRIVQFTGKCKVTYNASSMILPGAVDIDLTSANITTLTRAIGEFISLGSGNWICVHFSAEGTWTPADGSGASLVFTNTTQAKWRVVDDMCVANFDTTYPSTANGSSAAIGGLPFPIVANYFPPANIGYQTDTVLVRAMGNPTTSNIVLQTASSVASRTNVNCSTFRYMGSITYFR